MAGTKEALVEVDGLVRRHGDTVAVQGVSFAVQRGEMFGLIGPDGAGKTTTLKCILGLYRPDQGRVLTCGLDPIAAGRELSRRVGYLSQRFTLYGDLSVDENVAFFAAVHSVSPPHRRSRWGPRSGWKARRDELLDLLRLTPFRDRLADRLSGGMKQKLALACTLIHTPDLLVLDEPTTGVDPVSRREFWRILSGLLGQGITLLLTTPYLDEAERASRVAFIDRGRILALDTPAALKARSTGTIVELQAADRRRAAELLRARPDVSDVETFGERLHVTLRAGAGRDAAEIAADLADRGVAVAAARAVEASLEDVFIAAIRAAGGER